MPLSSMLDEDEAIYPRRKRRRNSSAMNFHVDHDVHISTSTQGEQEMRNGSSASNIATQSFYPITELRSSQRINSMPSQTFASNRYLSPQQPVVHESERPITVNEFLLHIVNPSNQMRARRPKSQAISRKQTRSKRTYKSSRLSASYDDEHSSYHEEDSEPEAFRRKRPPFRRHKSRPPDSILQFNSSPGCIAPPAQLRSMETDTSFMASLNPTPLARFSGSQTQTPRKRVSKIIRNKPLMLNSQPLGGESIANTRSTTGCLGLVSRKEHEDGFNRLKRMFHEDSLSNNLVTASIYPIEPVRCKNVRFSDRVQNIETLHGQPLASLDKSAMAVTPPPPNSSSNSLPISPRYSLAEMPPVYAPSYNGQTVPVTLDVPSLQRVVLSENAASSAQPSFPRYQNAQLQGDNSQQLPVPLSPPIAVLSSETETGIGSPALVRSLVAAHKVGKVPMSTKFGKAQRKSNQYRAYPLSRDSTPNNEPFWTLVGSARAAGHPLQSSSDSLHHLAHMAAS